ncbi:hypothetical protein QN397_03605 [Variovorax sp. RTB1]|uniref:hypothetical protein n=1 Tax=Variovorax sp. RTB1 TaxID=3048631 RepID=UPI002B23C99D|nr:hypothetical protein [Variovorax sp. RTB1]MEB0110440.1 hypothetical protein [Variovorax sp. RTB1]
MGAHSKRVTMRIFDCFLYNGEIEALEIRLHELNDVVDEFVIVEATKTFSGNVKKLTFPTQRAGLSAFVGKIRYIAIEDDIVSGNAWDRERFQRNSIVRGLVDAADSDLICVSDVDEIPRGEVVAGLRSKPLQVYGFQLLLSYFYLNYRNVGGPESASAWCCAFPKSELREHTPDQMRFGVRTTGIPATFIENAGWHFSYLADEDGVKRKIAAFSHQEYNNPEFLGAINIHETVTKRQDFYGRSDFIWDIVDLRALPTRVQRNPKNYRHLLVGSEGRRQRRQLSWWERIVVALK